MSRSDRIGAVDDNVPERQRVRRRVPKRTGRCAAVHSPRAAGHERTREGVCVGPAATRNTRPSVACRNLRLDDLAGSAACELCGDAPDLVTGRTSGRKSRVFPRSYGPSFAADVDRRTCAHGRGAAMFGRSTFTLRLGFFGLRSCEAIGSKRLGAFTSALGLPARQWVTVARADARLRRILYSRCRVARSWLRGR